ncbi:hypothetical protein [Dyadobacter sp. BHUBP1]|uniref:hypothetical protein n=1 Tax=Dyadobacter sp. BHUBP1 TaxID=3424178 RepID=UPI003D32EF26
MNITGNVISGQVLGDTAKHLSERFGKIQQDRTALSLNRSDTSISKSIQLDLAIPASKISSMSSGEFVGLVADNPDQCIDLKAFYNRIMNNYQALAAEAAAYKPIPVVRQVNAAIIKKVFEQIKDDVREIIENEIANIKQDPARKHLLVDKKK